MFCYGSVQRRHCSNIRIPAQNTCIPDARDRFIESFHGDAGRNLDRSSVEGGEKGVGQRHSEVGRLPEAVEQAET